MRELSPLFTIHLTSFYRSIEYSYELPTKTCLFFPVLGYHGLIFEHRKRFFHAVKDFWELSLLPCSFIFTRAQIPTNQRGGKHTLPETNIRELAELPKKGRFHGTQRKSRDMLLLVSGRIGTSWQILDVPQKGPT